MKLRNILMIASLSAMLAACNSAEDAAPAEEAAAAPTPQLTSSPTPIQAPDGSPMAGGAWAINESASGASATFGKADANALLIISCNSETRILSLAIESDAPASQIFVLESAGTAARLDTFADGNAALPYQVAEIAAAAPVFGGFVQPGSVIQVTYPGGNVLRVPAAAGIRRVFEACR